MLLLAIKDLQFVLEVGRDLRAQVSEFLPWDYRVKIVKDYRIIEVDILNGLSYKIFILNCIMSQGIDDLVSEW